MKRRMVTLLEVLISISLLSILLFALLSSYSNIKMVDTEIAKETHKAFKQRYLESRLEALLFQVLKSDKKTFFYTDINPFSSSPTLIFSYYNQAKIDPKFSGSTLGRLFVDLEGNLTLATWPSPDRYGSPPIPMRLEILEKGVKEISFLFFVPPKKDAVVDQKKVGDTVEPESNKWHTSWNKNYNAVPPLVKLRLVKQTLETVDFSFYLANNSYPLEL